MSPRRRYVRFLPGYALRVAHGLRQGRQRKDIAREMSQKYGISPDTIKEHLAKYFPQQELEKLAAREGLDKAIDILLWEYRRKGVKSFEEKRAIVERAEETRRQRGKTTVQITQGMSPERRRKIAVERERRRAESRTAIWQIVQGKTHEQLSDIAIDREAAKGSEKRSDIARKREAGKTPERRTAIAARAERTRLKRGKALWQIMGKKTPKQKKVIARRRYSVARDAERGRVSRRMWKGKTVGDRKRIARARNAELVKRGIAIWQIWKEMTFEQRSGIIRRKWAILSQKVKEEIARRGWETRRERLEEEAKRLMNLIQEFPAEELERAKTESSPRTPLTMVPTLERIHSLITTYKHFPDNVRNDVHARLARMIKAGAEARQKLSRMPPSRARKAVLEYRIIGLADEARKALVLHNLRLVLVFTKKYRGFVDRNPVISWEDILQAGITGLNIAVDSFNPKKGAFVTYAFYWIKSQVLKTIHESDPINFGNLLDEFAKVDRVLRAYDESATGKEFEEKIKEMSEETQQVARRIRSPEDAKKIGKNLGERKRLAAIARKPKYFEQTISSEDDRPLSEVLGIEDVDIVDRIEREELFRIINERLNRMPEREATIIRQRYLAEEPLDLRKLGKQLKLSAERVRQLQIVALEKLRNAIKKRLEE